MNIKQIEKQLKILKEKRSNLNNQIYDLEKKLALLKCPFNIGDIIKHKNGKFQAKIERIEPDGCDGFNLFGPYIIKNGKLSKVIHRLWPWEWNNE